MSTLHTIVECLLSDLMMHKLLDAALASAHILAQVVLTVDVVRVGTYAMLPNASMTSRSLIPLQADVSENEELMKMSGLMIYVSTP